MKNKWYNKKYNVIESIALFCMLIGFGGIVSMFLGDIARYTISFTFIIIAIIIFILNIRDVLNKEKKFKIKEQVKK